MIDVSRFRTGDRCPRCINRRVYQIDEDRNMWLCIDNARPVPSKRDQLTTHDAELFVELIQDTGEL